MAAPDGRLWLAGLSADGATLPEVVESLQPGAPEPSRSDRAAVAVFELGPAGLGEEVGRFRAPDIATDAWPGVVPFDPIAFGPDGRVYVAGHEAIYVFNGDDVAAPTVTLELPLPFARLTTDISLAPDGRLWVATNVGATARAVTGVPL